MKSKSKWACLTAAALLLVACSESSSSGGTADSRVKNEALTFVAPVIDKIEPGDSSLTVYVSLPDGSQGNIWFYQVSAPAGAANPLGDGTETVDNAPAKFTITGLTNGATYTVRVAHWNGETSTYASAAATPLAAAPTTTPAPTTTIAPTTTPAPTTTVAISTCNIGGDCKIGDIGPGGGVVFYDAGSVQPWGRYLEVAPNDLNRGQFGCIGAEPPGNAAMGAGFANSYEINLSTCASNSAATAAFTYTLNGSTGWYLPSRSELNELCKYANNQVTGDPTKACSKGTSLRAGFAPTFYWSSTQNGPNLAWYQSFVTGQEVGYGKPSLAAIRPIRAFTNKDGMTVPTTVPAVRCNRGGECKVGDTGPGGGTVFFVAPTLQSWGQYMEITKTPLNNTSWGCTTTTGLATRTDFGSGPTNTRTLVAAGCDAAVIADRYVSANGVDDWFLPSSDELFLAATARAFSGVQSAWSSSDDGCGFGFCWAWTRTPDGSRGSSSRGSTDSSKGLFAVRMFKKVG
jgi:hypothetical protein